MNAKPMRRGVVSWAGIALLLMFLQPVGARDFFVGTHGDDANPGTVDQPFLTIQKAAETLEPGDTCRVGSGRYPGRVRPGRSGRFDSPIRYVAVTGETVTVTGEAEGAGDRSPGKPDGAARNWGFDLEGLSLIELSGFDFQGVGINLTGASYCRVEDCRVRSAGGVGVSGDGRAGDSKGEWEGAIRIGGKENEVVRCSVTGSGGNGIVFLPGSVNNRISGLLVRDASNGYGVVVAGTAQTVRQSTILDCSKGAVLCSNLFNGRLLNNEFHRTGGEGGPGPLVLMTGNGKGTILAYNWIYNSGARGGDGVLIEGPAENYLLHHNVIWGHAGSAIRLRGRVQYCLVFNNTCAANGSGLERDGTAGAGGLKGMRFFNNLFSGAVWSATGGEPAEGVVWEHNYVGQAPGFVNESDRQFSLVADSPCIDAGQDEPELTDAYSGRSPDAGAYEFGRDFQVPGCQGAEPANQTTSQRDSW